MFHFGDGWLAIAGEGLLAPCDYILVAGRSLLKYSGIAEPTQEEAMRR